MFEIQSEKRENATVEMQLACPTDRSITAAGLPFENLSLRAEGPLLKT